MEMRPLSKMEMRPRLFNKEAILMTEIQLKNIVERMGADPDTNTDGVETTVKDGIRISKFSKEAMKTGKDVKEGLKAKGFCDI
jgi:hypothetical protein